MDMAENISGKYSFADKYAPKSIDEMILDQDIKDRFKVMIKNRTPINMTLYGVPGIGKTTLANLIVDELGRDDVALCYVNCGIDNSVDMVRSRLVDFIDSYQPDKIKIVIMDEADSLSGTSSGTEGNSAQKALRSVMCTDDCVFILTCNNLGQLSSAIQSRCTPIKLHFSNEDVLRRCVEILKNENIKFNKDIVAEFYNKILVPSSPDIRSIIRQLEFWCADGIMKNIEGTMVQTELEQMATTIQKKLVDKVPPREISKFYIEHSDEFNSNYEGVASCLFRLNYGNPDAQLIIAEHLYRMSMVYDKEIQFYAMLLLISSKIPGRV